MAHLYVFEVVFKNGKKLDVAADEAVMWNDGVNRVNFWEHRAGVRHRVLTSYADVRSCIKKTEVNSS